MGKDLKKTLPNPECELFYPEDKTAHSSRSNEN